MIDYREKLINLCVKSLKDKELYNKKYQERLKLELGEIDAQAEHEYFLELYDKNVKYPSNENNLLIPFLLGIVDDFDIDKLPIYVQGEFPDIDIDYLPMVRDYLKNDWAPKVFGEQNVCNIGNYTTFGIKSSLLDMAFVHGEDKNHVQRLTTQIGLKDEDGKPLTWEKALESNEELAAYCAAHPDVADSAHRLVDRNRGKGKHAGGLIISKSRIDDLVPLVIDTDGNPASAWVEGLHAQDLQPVGLVKFDLLVITNLVQIAKCCKFIKERHGLESICALEGQPDWSDTSYLEDKKSLALANAGNLKCIFQFDSKGIRDLAKRAGVTCFEDLTALSALYRPGPLGEGMHERFIERKRGKESYSIHPLMRPILKYTYGIMIYQEQVMQILNVVGDIPLIHCEKVRKAISKKDEKGFSKYKEQFIINGQKNLNWNKEKVEALWSQISAFSEYGFNLSHAVAYTYISSRLLWLKAHYPLEFFAAVLSCESDDEKIKEYKLEAERSGLRVNRIDLNKSKVIFDINDDEIYIGFSNIKGIGEDIAQKIVDNQPYSSFEDFLHRFGADTKVLKPLIALNIFGERDRVITHEYWEYFKKESKRRQDRNKRHLVTREKNLNAVKEILERKNIQYYDLEKFISNWMEDSNTKLDVEVTKACKKYQLCIERFETKVAEDAYLTFSDFVSKRQIDKETRELYEADISVAEESFYGFSWEHMLQDIDEFDPDLTFEQFEDGSIGIAPIQARVIVLPKITTSKKGNKYCVFEVEDVNWRVERVTMWNDDYERFKDELRYWESDIRKGNLVKIRLKRPDPGFRNYTFDSPPRHLRRHVIPEDKAKDYRLRVLKRPCPKKN